MNPYAPPASSDPPPRGGGQGRIDVGIDFGTSKICIAVGEIKPSGRLSILGVVICPSRGVERGRIVDMALVGACLRAALDAAESAADVIIKNVYLSITDASMTGFNHSAGINLPENRSLIMKRDREVVEDRAREVVIPDHDIFFHSLLQSYRVDGVACISNPVGLECRRLEADFHLVHGAKEPIQNFIKSGAQQGVDVDDVVFSPFAAARAVLDEDQKTRGALLIDLGAGTTNYVMYRDGIVHQSGALAIGSDQISHDISICCGVSFAEAERLKTEEGSALPGIHRIKSDRATTNNPLIESGKVERQKLNEIIHARIREILELLKRKLDAEPALHELGAAIFLTGGGSLLTGIAQLTEEVFGIPAQPIRGSTIFGLKEKFQNPRYASALGLVLWNER